MSEQSQTPVADEAENMLRGKIHAHESAVAGLTAEIDERQAQVDKLNAEIAESRTLLAHLLAHRADGAA